MPFASSTEDRDRTPQEAEGVLESALGPPQRGPQIQEDRPLQTVPSTLLEDGPGGLKRLVRRREVESHPAGVADVGPGSRPKIGNAFGSIPRCVHPI